MSFGEQIIQSEHGDSKRFQRNLHFVKLCASVASSCLILVFAYPLARWFDIQEQTWAFAILAIIPILNGFGHTDIVRVRRVYNFLPSIWTQLIPNIAITLMTWPLAFWLRDFRVVLIILISKGFITLVTSHLFSERKFEFRLYREFLPTVIAFSWPLVLNGFLMFASNQADRMLVGIYLSLESAGEFSAAFQFATLAFFLLGNVCSSIFMPLLSNCKDRPCEFLKSYRSCVETISFLATLCILPMAAVGEHVIHILYGDKYSGIGPITAMLTIATAIRFLRTASATAALTKANTKIIMFSNLLKSSSLLFAGIAIYFGGTLLMIVCGSVAAEFFSLLLSNYLLRRNYNLGFREYVKGYALVFLACVSFGAIGFLETNFSFLLSSLATAALMAVFLLLSKKLTPSISPYLVGIAQRLPWPFSTISRLI